MGADKKGLDLLRVVLLGRPNVGKSTLFNRILGRKQAIEGKTPYLTRDRNETIVKWDETRFLMVDVAGLFPDKPTELTGKVDLQIGKAIDETDLALVLVNAAEGLSPFDAAVLEEVRNREKPFLLVVNKVDNDKRENEVFQFSALGVEPIFSISAMHGRGVSDLLDTVVEKLALLTSSPATAGDDESDDQETVRIAVVGRPNVGKSTLINALAGDERVIAHSMPCTTRDTVEVPIKRKGRPLVLIDTAGMRYRRKVKDTVEKLSVSKTVNAIKSAHVAVLIIDATTGVTTQDKKIAALVTRKYCACVVGVNKWDLVENSRRPVNIPGFIKMVRKELRFLNEAPFVFISAKTGKYLGKLIAGALDINDRLRVRVNTSDLNSIVEDITARHLPPTIARGGQRLKIFYGTQIGILPPRFLFFVNRTDYLTPTYRRYLTAVLKERLGLTGVPTKLIFRARESAFGRRKV